MLSDKCWVSKYDNGEYKLCSHRVCRYDSDVKKNDCANTGIKMECNFNRIANFDIVDSQSVDLIHDVYDGIASYTINKVL